MFFLFKSQKQTRTRWTWNFKRWSLFRKKCKQAKNKVHTAATSHCDRLTSLVKSRMKTGKFLPSHHDPPDRQSSWNLSASQAVRQADSQACQTWFMSHSWPHSTFAPAHTAGMLRQSAWGKGLGTRSLHYIVTDADRRFVCAHQCDTDHNEIP